MKASFTEKDFQSFRNFQNKVNKQFGETAYVGTDSATFFIDYSPQLKAMIRPGLHDLYFEYEVKALGCQDCKRNVVFMCLSTEETFVCDDCKVKRSKKGQQKKVEA